MKAIIVSWALIFNLSIFGEARSAPTVPAGYSIENYATGIGAANGLARGPDGLLYITDYANGQLLKRTISGAIEVVASNIPNASGVAFSPAGRIFVVGGYSDVYEIVGGVPQVFATGFSSLTAIAAKGDDLYVSSSGNGVIGKISTTTGAVTNVLTGIGNPHGLSIDALGNLYYINHASGQLYEYNFVDSPRLLTNVSPYAGTHTGFGFGGQLFWGDSQLAGLYRLTTAGASEEFATGFAGSGAAPAIGPNGILPDGVGAILVADGHDVWRIADSSVTILNRSFDADPPSAGYVSAARNLPGWQVTSGNIDIDSFGVSSIPSADGAFWIDLTGTDDAGTITQSITTNPGQAYSLSFYFGANAQK